MLTAKFDFTHFADWAMPRVPAWDPAVRRPAKAAASLRPFMVHFSGPEAADRAELEQFVRNVFQRAYGAEIKYFMPLLMSLRDHSGAILAVCGLRRADQRLFLEAYLDQPIEAMLAQRIKQNVERHDIIEIGNLAVANPGMARYLITALTEHLHATDIKWAVFTAVPMLCNASSKLGIPLEWLCAADQNRLDPAERREWGSYYERNPQVMAVGRVPERNLLYLPELAK